MPPRRSARLYDQWASKQCRFSEEVVEMIIQAYFEKWENDKSLLLFPLLQSCKAINRMGLKLLYCCVVIDTEDALRSFLTCPHPSSYFLVNALDIRVVLLEEERYDFQCLIAGTRKRIGDWKKPEGMTRWESDEEHSGAEGDEGYIQEGTVYAVRGAVPLVEDLSEIYQSDFFVIDLDDFLDPSADWVIGCGLVILSLDKDVEVDQVLNEIETNLPHPPRDLPPLDSLKQRSNALDFKLRLQVWPEDHGERFLVAKAREALRILMHLVPAIHADDKVYMDCGAENHFFCAGGKGSHHERLELMGCEDGKCPLKGKKHPHPCAAAIEKIFRGEKKKTVEELRAEELARLAAPAGKHSRSE